MAIDYLIIGGGPTAANAIEGIRAHDTAGSIRVLSRENHLSYRRPPLSKDLWFGKTTLDQISLHDAAWYRDQNVEMLLRREAVELDAAARAVWDDRNERHEYGKLLIATGAKPRLLPAPAASVEGIHYFRSLEDYISLRERL